MSFITKRERVFNEYDLFDLPARNEGKLKAYASCTDARAWSHFCSDKSEHLVEVIKKNNETVRPKYLPTSVIVETLMVAKNAEIARLKHKIEEFEQMLSAYDQLELSCDQKCEIAHAHAAIKAANKELDELCLDLDLSDFTEGIDSEGFATGKSRGDEATPKTGDFEDSVHKGVLQRDPITKSTPPPDRSLGTTPKSDFKATPKSDFEDSVHKGVPQRDPVTKPTSPPDRPLGATPETSDFEDSVDKGHQRDPITKPTLPPVRSGVHPSEQPPLKRNSKGDQNDGSCTCDVATLVKDSRIDEMHDTIITKDAKLSAMKNTIAVLENDICEPFCVYAHIYTALAKIFSSLCQNDKYKQYLKLLTAGKDTSCIDIRGKILYKLKVLENFCCALIAPCVQDFTTQPTDDCTCYRIDSLSRIEPGYALTAIESKVPNLDNKRAKLVADIIQSEEMKEILSKESSSINQYEDQNDVFVVDYNIDTENLKRLKSLQENYNDLVKCYEKLKSDKDSLEERCNEYEEMEKEFESLKVQVREYNSLWNEKEHYRKRSANLDALKEQYLILTDETSSLETQLKAEAEINHIKCKAMDNLRTENISLEKKLNEASVGFEREKNTLLCKLKEADCRVICQEQQINSLLLQIDKLLEQNQERAQTHESETQAIAMMDEIDSLKEQIKNLKDALFCNEEEKQDLQKLYQNHLEFINVLKLELEDWKSTCEKTLQRNDYLEKYNENLIEEAKLLNRDMDEKSNAVDNLINVIKNKSQEINKLMQDVEMEREKNRALSKQLNELREKYDSSLVSLENEKLEALQSLQVAKQDSQELLEKVEDYEQVVHKKNDVTKSLEQQLQDNKKLQDLLMTTTEENRNLLKDLGSREKNNSILLQEVERLRDVNECAVERINSLEDAKKQYKTSLDLIQKENDELKDKIMSYENLKLQLQNLQDSHEKLMKEKTSLENELLEKSHELENAIHSIQLSKRESEDLIDKLQQSEDSKDNELSRISEAYQKLSSEKYAVQKDLLEKKREMDNLLQTLKNLKLENERLLQKCSQADDLVQELEDLKQAYAELSHDKNMLEANKTEEYNHLYNALESKIEENRDLIVQIKCLDRSQATTRSDMEALQDENMRTQTSLNVIKRESSELVDKIKQYETLETEYEKLKRAHDQMATEKENLQTELNMQLDDLKRMERENSELHSYSQNLLSHNEDLESALIGARTEVIEKSSIIFEPYKNIMAEIEVMRNEKLHNQKKIRDLLDKLDEAENIISSLSEDVLARDVKIATLQNHLNELEEEVTRLHDSLNEVINTGEQIKDFSLQKIDTLNNMEAHHSKATHNMKMEVAKLQNENFMLSEQLSVTKVKFEESSQDKYQYTTQIKRLQDERELIWTDIKQLELESVGDSALGTDNGDVEEVLASLDRIRKSFKARTSKSSLLERTLLKVQTSSQLLISKADEAKKIVEREKQKIISEKEDAIIDKQNMETQLYDLKAKLEKQIANDKDVIENLEAKILNQKLMIDRINKSTQDYISKLQEELQTLKDLYQNSVEKIGELQEKLQSMTKDKSKLLDEMEEIKADLGKKSNEVAELQKQLEALKKKPHRNVEAQAKITDINRNMESQTDKELMPIEINKKQSTEISATMKNTKEKNIDNVDSINTMEVNNPPLEIKYSTKLEMKRENPLLLNEVQILSSAVEQPFDVVKNSYVEYKMKRLSMARLVQYSITCFNDKEIEKSENEETMSSPPKKLRIAGKHSATAIIQNNNLIDIYNRQSIHTNSSKENDESENTTSETIVSQSQGKSTRHAAKHESATDSNIISKYKDSKTSVGTTLDRSTDMDLFVIYKDSESSHDINKGQSQRAWLGKGHPEVVVEAVTIYPTKKRISSDMNHPKNEIEENSFIFHENKESLGGDSERHKLQINLPGVGTESRSLVTTSDVDKKSLDSYTVASPKTLSDLDNKSNEYIDGNPIKHVVTPLLSTISNEDNQYLEPYNSIASKQKHSHISRKKDTISTPFDSESYHNLSRVGADVLLHKAEQDQKSLRQNFGLEYIIDTVQGEVDPDAAKYYGAEELRKTKSDEIFNLIKIKERSDSSEFKVSSTEYKTISINSKSSDKSPPKPYIDRSTLAKLDVKEDYEIKIKSLTMALENTEKDYKKKIEAIKMQYDSNIKSIINEHNQGVKSIQSLHEETLQDIIKLHENEVENLRTMSIEAMRKADKLEKENQALKNKLQDCRITCIDDEPTKITSPEIKKRMKCRDDTKMLTKTMIEAFNVKPKTRSIGPCTCSLDVNISDTIRNIFEQVDVEQRKMAEHTYLKYIANKILNANGSSKIDGLQTLDAQELSFLHLKVCRMWKTKLTKEEALQKRIVSLENELISKQRCAQQHIAELDRKVAEERRRLQEVRDAVCRRTPAGSRTCSPDPELHHVPPPTLDIDAEKDACVCNAQQANTEVSSHESAGDQAPELSNLGLRARRARPDSNKTALTRPDAEERREKRLYNDEPPTRLRRSNDRQPLRFATKK